MGEDHEQGKQEVRQAALASRDRVGPEMAVTAAAAICRRAQTLAALAGAAHVALYAPIDHEVDPTGLAIALKAAGKRLYYPRVADGGLEFLAADPVGLQPGRFGIPEPRTGASLPA